MKLLLDTHTLIWRLAGDPSLSALARQAIANRDNDVWVSAVSAFEVATKFRLGKLPEAELLAWDFAGECLREEFQALAISAAHGAFAGALRLAHRDPFDRLLIAQAMSDGMTLVSNETLFDASGVQRLW